MRENNVSEKIPQKPIHSMQHFHGSLPVMKSTSHSLTMSLQSSILALSVWLWHISIKINEYSFLAVFSRTKQVVMPIYGLTLKVLSDNNTVNDVQGSSLHPKSTQCCHTVNYKCTMRTFILEKRREGEGNRQGGCGKCTLWLTKGRGWHFIL